MPARTANNVQARRAAIEKAEKFLGFRAGIDLESGLRLLVEWRTEIKSETAVLAGGGN